eukprot:jgi/Phyca11/21719/fgenesh1_pg.PHYCAscaffold_109_\
MGGSQDSQSTPSSTSRVSAADVSASAGFSGVTAGSSAASPRAATVIPDRADAAGAASSFVYSDQLAIPLADANVAPLPLDTPVLRSSIAAIETALEREGAFQQLREDYANLRRQLRSVEDHSRDLENQIREAVQLSSPFVQFCQERYDAVRHDLRESRQQFDDVVNALAGHEGDRVRIADLEDQLQRVQQQHSDVVADLNSTISNLTDQLTAALLRIPAASQDLQRLRGEVNSLTAARADLEQALAGAIAARDRFQVRLATEINDHLRTRRELTDLQATNGALTASQEALETATEQLKLIAIKPGLISKTVKPNFDGRVVIVIARATTCSHTEHTLTLLVSQWLVSRGKWLIFRSLLVIFSAYGRITPPCKPTWILRDNGGQLQKKNVIVC